MDRLAFNRYFDLRFQLSHTTEFEKWFLSLASKTWLTDFEFIKAGGPNGDKKSDGRRISTETVYQCYAPESPATFAANATTKLKDSFPEVTEYWPNLREWIFVHNNADGFSTGFSDALEQLREQYPHIKISTATRDFLKDCLHDKLTLEQMADVYPESMADFQNVKMEHISPLLKKIVNESTNASVASEFGENPGENKLDHNELGYHSKLEIKRARPFTGIVSRYLESLSPVSADKIQTELREKYTELNGLGYQSDELLGGLNKFVKTDDTASVLAATWIILTYFFDACDIFENAPEG